jgi:hypothetical protein
MLLRVKCRGCVLDVVDSDLSVELVGVEEYLRWVEFVFKSSE